MIHIIPSRNAAIIHQQKRQTAVSTCAALLLTLGLALGGYLSPLRLWNHHSGEDFTGVTFIPQSEPDIPQAEPCAELRIQAPPAPPIIELKLPALSLELVAEELPDIEFSEEPAPPFYEALDTFSQPAPPQKNLPPSPRQKPVARNTPGTAKSDAADFTPPAYKDCPQPPYPAALRSRRVQGEVALSIIIGADGLPQSVEITTSSGHPALDRQARRWVQQNWSFTPATRNGHRIESRVNTTIIFTLER